MPGSHHDIIKNILYFSGALLVVTAFRKTKEKLYLWRAIAASGVLVFIIAILHALAGETSVYGLRDTNSEYLVTPFINPNHAAGFLGFASLISLGLTLHEETRIRFLYLTAAVLTGAGVMLSLSRGGVIAYLMTLIFLFIAIRSQTFKPTKYPRNLMAFLTMAIGIISIASFLSSDALVQELSTVTDDSKNLGKFSAWDNSLPYSKTFSIWCRPGRLRKRFSLLPPRQHSDVVDTSRK